MRDARLLIVDDDDSIRKIFKVNLEEEGYVVDVAGSGKEALMKIEEKFYNIVFIDIKLGDMEGTDLLKMLANKRPRMRKIIVTGFPTLENAILAVNEGTDGYLLKPVKIEELLKVIDDQLREQRKNAKYGEDQIKKYVEDRVHELETMKRYYKPI
ncbi:response regulator [Candidatus Bathyarchaeota archaeon]|nr:response regulator [Candidatus Bathyarchaeota archaeon]